MRKVVVVDDYAKEPRVVNDDLVVIHTGITAWGEEVTVERAFYTAMKMRPDVIEIRLSPSAE